MGYRLRLVMLFHFGLLGTLAATMIFEAEVSMTRQLDFNDVHSDVESIAPIIPGRECTTPQKSFSIPFYGSSYTPDCDDTLKPNIGMTFTDVESAKEFYKRYAHHVGFFSSCWAAQGC